MKESEEGSTSESFFYQKFDEEKIKPIEKNQSENSKFFSSEFPNFTIKLSKEDLYACPVCHMLPEIKFLDQDNIEVSCDCYKEKYMSIVDFLDSIKGNKNIDDEKINKLLLCQINNHSKIFTKYCDDCKKNICEICEQEHKNHSLKNLESQDINKKREFIFNFTDLDNNTQKNEIKNIDTQTVIKTEENSTIFNQSELNESKNQTIKLFQTNNIKEIKFLNDQLLSLIDKITTCSKKFNNYSSYKNIENIYNFLYPRYEAHNKKQLQIEYKVINNNKTIQIFGKEFVKKIKIIAI